MQASTRVRPRFGVLALSALLALLPLLLTAPRAAADPPPLDEDEQAAVNRAIDHGIYYLRATQTRWGTWSADKGPAEADRGPHWVGRTALTGLTLLECGVPADDRGIQAAAARVRESRDKLAATYELALAVLFLDRLGNPKDEPLIELFALRLIAGQSPSGGWTYRCPVLTPTNHKQLLTILRQLPPIPAIDAPSPGASTPSTSGTPSPGSTGPPPSTSGSSSSGSSGSPPLSAAASPPAKPPGGPGAVPAQPGAAPAAAPVKIPPNLAVLPVLNDPKLFEKWVDPKDKLQDPITGTTDNSNSQFAILALWAARRHNLPMERTLNLMAQRYRNTQNADGGYGYLQTGGTAPPMTCVGLLGLAVGVGLAEDRSTRADDVPFAQLPRTGMCVKVADGPASDPEPELPPPLWAHQKGLCIKSAEFPAPNADPQAPAVPQPLDKDKARVLKGLTALSGFLGKPAGRMKDLPPVSLYFLWSVERVGVLYNLRQIGDKDWYRWGAEILVANQAENGGWAIDGGYPGQDAGINTCLALLFLKRANLVSDLSSKLRYDPGTINKEITDRTAPALAPTPPLPAPPVETPAAVTPPRPEPPIRAAAPPPAPVQAAEPQAGRSAWLWLLLLIPAVLLLAAGAVLALYFYQRQPEDREEKQPRKKAPKGDKAPRRKRPATSRD